MVLSGVSVVETITVAEIIVSFLTGVAHSDWTVGDAAVNAWTLQSTAARWTVGDGTAHAWSTQTAAVWRWAVGDNAVNGWTVSDRSKTE